MGRLRRKIAFVILIGGVCLAALGVCLTLSLNFLSVRRQQTDIAEKMSQLAGIVADAEANQAQLEETFNDVYQSKAATLAYMIREDINDSLDWTVLAQYRQLINVSNILVLDRKGNVLHTTERSLADFPQESFEHLRAVFDTGAYATPLESENDRGRFRYYGARIDRQMMVVVEQSTEGLNQILGNTATWRGTLENVNVGMDGFVFAMSADDYTILYHPDERLVGLAASDAGISVSGLNAREHGWLTISGQRFYCGVVKSGGTYLVCAVSEDEIYSSNGIIAGILLFVFFIVVAVIGAYAIFMLQEEWENGALPEDYRYIGKYCYHKRVGRKILTVSVVGVAIVLVISFYIQTLFSLSRISMSNTQHLEEVENTIARNQGNVELVTTLYDQAYLSKGQTLAYILTEKPELAERSNLAELSRALGVEFICVYDETGRLTATDSGYSHFTLSNDPGDQSYEFRQLLRGVPYLIQEARLDDLGQIYRKYVGVTLRTASGEANGFVQIAVRPGALEEAVAALDLASILQGFKVGTNGFAYAVDRETGAFIYYPVTKYIGHEAADYGMEDHEFSGKHSGYIDLESVQYFGTSMETEDAYIYVVVPMDEITGSRWMFVLASTGVCLLGLILLCLSMVLERRENADDVSAVGAETAIGAVTSEKVIGTEASDASDAVSETAAASGSASRARSNRAANWIVSREAARKSERGPRRWSRGVDWSEKTAEQKTMTVFRVLMSILSVLIVISVLFRDRLFDQNSVFSYVLDGSWERGINIFAWTACVIQLCVVSVISMALQNLCRFLAQSLDAQGETICHMISNFIKYVSVLAALYYCCAMFGVDTSTLLASAGILSLVIGLGAQDLVKDIVAGLFIIFEGSFRVGDIVTIGDWFGTVVEIGVRTTKVEDVSKNIKIFNNSTVSNVINMTRRESFAVCDVSIEYGESLERVESVLQAELPKVKGRLEAILAGPHYYGVQKLSDSGVIIRIKAQCAEKDRLQLERDLNREIKLIFDRNHINIPFPQVVLNQPVEFAESAEWKRQMAERPVVEKKEAKPNKRK